MLSDACVLCVGVGVVLSELCIGRVGSVGGCVGVRDVCALRTPFQYVVDVLLLLLLLLLPLLLLVLLLLQLALLHTCVRGACGQVKVQHIVL